MRLRDLAVVLPLVLSTTTAFPKDKVQIVQSIFLSADGVYLRAYSD